MDKLSKSKELIIEAAMKRFRHFGFNKTTMVELAEDCQMSAANIYRFFKGKKDILATIVVEQQQLVESRGRDIVELPNLSSRQKITLFLTEIFELQYDFYKESPRIQDSINYITQHRIDLIMAHKAVKISMLVAIIQQGIFCGEFQVIDAEQRAEAIISSLLLFHTPIFYHLYSYDELTVKCAGVIEALLEGVMA